MKIIAVRHGETEGNVLHVVQSRTHGRLTDAGFQQAQAIANALRHEHIDAIYSSNLQRASNTAFVIAELHQNSPLHFTQYLRERDKGDFEGQQYTAVPESQYEGEFLAARMPNGESWRDVEHRIELLLNGLFIAHQNETVLLVTHGGTIKALRALLTGISLAKSIDLHVQNGEIFRWEMAWPLDHRPEDIAV